MHTFPGNVLLCLSNSIPDFICWNWQQSGVLVYFSFGVFFLSALLVNQLMKTLNAFKFHRHLS